MCGICGFVGFRDDELLLRMMARLQHRGPDEGGYLTTDVASLGHRRLSIIDLDSGLQPIANEEGTVWVSFNGEIYNYEELRCDLVKRGHRFQTRTDTEVIVHAYEEFGAECLQRFNGMWALALWDVANRRLLLARDRMGIKPLCYLQMGERLLFTSEYKAFLECRDFTPEPDMESIASYVDRRYVANSRTMLKQVKKLPPGHYALFEDGDLRITRYWQVAFAEARNAASPDGWLEEFQELLHDAVRLRLVSDVPLGAYLSGGLDSSSIVGFMSELDHHPIETFCVGFDREFDELEPARAASERVGGRHHDLTVQADDLDLLADCVWYQEDPVGDVIVVPLLLLSRLARSHVKVVLTGEGADEQFGGYVHHTAILRAARLDRILPRIARRIASQMIRLTPVTLLDRAFQYPDSIGEEGRNRMADFLSAEGAARRYRLASSLFSDVDKERYFHMNVLPEGDGEGELSEHALANSLVSREFESWLPDNILHKQDRLSMANGIEARVPFLDHRLVEAAAQCPGWLKNDGRHDKIMLRRSLANIVPPGIRTAKKRAFYMPLDGDFGGKFLDLVHTYLSPARVKSRGLFRDDAVPHLVRESEGSTLIRHKQLAAMLVLELWFEEFLESPRAAQTTATEDAVDVMALERSRVGDA